MKVTKYEHATLVLEEQGKKLIIDPGNFTKSLTDLNGVVGIVITHAHQDHFDKPLVDKILSASPEAKIFTVSEVATQLQDHQTNVETVKAGESCMVGPFHLTFFGGKHALIHGDMPSTENVGVFVNETLYYPGDSFSVPEGVGVGVLALPTTAPWLKIGESMDFLLKVKPKAAFPTHDGLHNDIGEQMANGIVGRLAEEHHITFKHLKVGDQLDI